MSVKENWVKKLKEKTAIFNEGLEAFMQRIDDIKLKDRFSEATTVVSELERMPEEIEEFHRLVI